MNQHIDVIATTMSGSIKDWAKVKRIVPLFKEYGIDDVSLLTADSHIEARKMAKESVQSGTKILISAGGSGTFYNVLEGCYDADVDIKDLRLGFLRKGSADLIGKVLQMPDEIQAAIRVFVESINKNHVMPCDVILAESESGGEKPRRFVGYGGAEIFGEIPYFTENRFIKYYKGILSQLFGDLGPFFTGATLTIIRRLMRSAVNAKRKMKITIDGKTVAEGYYQALIIVNGDLGPNLPFAQSVPLGSGDFHLFTIKDMGFLKLFKQFKDAWNAKILDQPEKMGFDSYCIKKQLKLKPEGDKFFPVNIDGATMSCRGSVSFKIVDQIQLIRK
ncbi:MAG: diacylglycerol kinase family protein [Candidatus Electryonea clarkiae]|nr:diacylglycerol kinase family protein [Candidatus Electryonea clarkiae]MDP8288014.1 diacylglycerol kinase family protein [Candidatus Electryonea clarkiae]